MISAKWAPIRSSVLCLFLAACQFALPALANAANISLASGVVVTASSESVGTSQLASKAIDGVVDGWPGDFSAEWATVGEGAGAWIDLAWPSSYLVDQVVIYDRPNTNDHILSATLQFSDGSTVPVGALDNGGAPTPITFSARVVDSVRLIITSVSGATVNVGLSEIEVYGSATGNQPPTADAGSDQTVSEGALVELDGSGSSDPDLDFLTYAWTQISGIEVALSPSSSANPEFTAPSGLSSNEELVFRLAVDDGLATDTDTVSVTVQASLDSTNITLASGVVVTASSESVGTSQLALKAIDGVVDGWPGDFSAEWATLGEGAGAWIDLAWPSSYLVDQVVIYDRPNTNDHILSATLQFSDGSTVPVGTLDNSGAPTPITFSARVVNGVRLIITSVSGSTANIGLAEIEVFGGEPCSVTPSVTILNPLQNDLQTSTDLEVKTLTCLDSSAHAGWGVKFTLDDTASLVEFSPPYSTTFIGVAKAEHTIDAIVVDSAGVEQPGLSDTVSAVGVGDYYVAIGDSITWGAVDDISSDDTSLDGRNTGGGFTPILNNLLTNQLSYPHTVVNEGIPGIKSAGALFEIPAVIAAYPDAQTYLVKYGMNDAYPFLPVPSGYLLEPGDPGYPGSFKDNMQQIIDLLNAADKSIFIAKVNIALSDTLDGPRYPDPNVAGYNLTIQEYNLVIDELVSDPNNQINLPVADFYELFSTDARYETEYGDAIHPNGLGYQSMADRWREVLVSP
jgi:lysophospholipase L1-like esterase